MQKGKIGVTTDNIFPVIKKFLYSDHEIFLRELVSNAVDATQKLRTLAQRGEVKGELGDLTVRISTDKDKGTLTISDRGIGMTAEEIDKYINQIAFSGAGEFLEKYKNDAAAIIGHFGLGFYSAFMVSKKVEIVTLSYKEGAKAVRWSCEGSPEFELEETEKKDRGTDIILHIDDEQKDFLEKYKVEELLKKYCRFLPVAIACGIAESNGLKRVMIANHAGDHSIYPDCRSPFIEAMSTAMMTGTYEGIRVFAPYTDLSKADIARHGAALGLDYSETYSCYKGGEKHCGTCGTCTERRQALKDADIDDTTEYLV